jgi:iron complex transport system permease protein
VRLAYTLSAAALLGLIALAFAVGRYPVSIPEILSLITGGDVPANVETIVLQVRGPRVLAALLVGAALAAAGTAYQGMFRNPLVSPDILGVSSGAALGAVLAIFLALGAVFVNSLLLRAACSPWRWFIGSDRGCAATTRCSRWCSPAW